MADDLADDIGRGGQSSAASDGRDVRSLLVAGLRNAHALEKEAETMLEAQSRALDLYPELQARLVRHIDETREQIQRLERSLDRLGTSHSSLKDVALEVQASMQGVMHRLASDEVLRTTFAAYAFENYEIAVYKALIAMAEAAGEQAVAEDCRATLEEELRMADWLDEHIADIVEAYLRHVGSGEKGRAVA